MVELMIVCFKIYVCNEIVLNYNVNSEYIFCECIYRI